MYDELIKRLRTHNGWALNETLDEAADAIEAQDRHILTLQHEMMAEAESHIALVERLNKQIEELQKRVPKRPHGRLIDADALAERFWNGQCYFTDAIKNKLQTAPTIIPAEEGE